MTTNDCLCSGISGGSSLGSSDTLSSSSGYKIYYKSEFDFILNIKHPDNDSADGWPSWDWEALLWTSDRNKSFVASCIDGECSGCFNDDGKIHIVVDGEHGLGAGRLKVEFTAYIPNDNYPDGFKRDVSMIALGIELTTSSAGNPSGLSASMVNSNL